MYRFSDASSLSRAVQLAKADLMSEMVYEFTELQGLMGYYYALKAGESQEDLPSTKLSAIVAMSLKLDTLIGLFSVEQIPTGSRDPFALRRAVNGLIKIVNEFEFDFDIVYTIETLSVSYAKFDQKKLETFFIDRIKQFYKVNPSVIEAVLASGERDLFRIGKKIEALNNLVNSADFGEISSTFKRVANITKDTDLTQEMSVDKKLFEDEAEKVLYTSYNEVIAKDFDSYEQELDALLGLKPQLDSFFSEVMVNVEDETIKNNRKSLVANIYKSILSIADIKEVSI